MQGSDGNFYGTTASGGANGNGTIFKMTSSGILTTLVDFTGTNGSNKGSSPFSVLVQGNDGNFYGATEGGGTSDWGTIFQVTPGGAFTTLVEFTGNGGSIKGMRATSLVQGADGNFYGATELGGAFNIGTAFKMTPTGVLTTLLEFTGTNGQQRCLS